MAHYDITGNYVAGDFAVANDVYNDLIGITTQLNGLLDATNLATGACTLDKLATNSVDANKILAGAVRETHADYSDTNDGLLAARVGPDYFASSAGGRLAFLNAAITRSNGTTTEDFTINLLTAGNFVHGAPGFSASFDPYLLGCPTTESSTANHLILGSRVTAMTNASMTVELEFAGISDTDLTINGALWGAV